MTENNNRYQIWPLIKVQEPWGDWSIPDQLLAHTWYELQEGNRYQDLFYTGLITDVESYIAWLKDEGNQVIFVADAKEKKLCYVSWLNHFFPPGGAWIHHAALGRFRIGAAKAVMDWWRHKEWPDGVPIIWVLLGLTPSYNKATVKLMKRLGFQILGNIPYACPDIYREKIYSGILGSIDLRSAYHG